MIPRKKKQETLSDKISGILSSAHTTFDPEDDIYDETKAKVNESENQDSEEEDVGLSKFRKANVDLLEEVDKRYVGKKGSRKSIKDSDDEWSTEDEGLSTDEGEALDGIEGTQEKVSEDEFETGDEEDDDDGEDTDEGDDDERDEDESESDFSDGGMFVDEQTESKDDDFKHVSETNVSNQNKKGNCVRNQLNIWENLLEMRIQLQKCLVQSNKMPQYDVYKTFESDQNFKTEVNKTKRNMKNVLSKLLDLQLLVLKKYPETKTILKDSKPKKEESDEEIPSDTDEELKEESSDEEEEEKLPKKRQKLSEIEQEIATRHNKYREYRNSVIQKWNDKTRLSLAKNNSGSNSIIQHINFLLEDKQKLVKRTQLKRSEYEILGKVKPEIKTDVEEPSSSKSPDEYDTEIYDDDDFYHQLLRELIEFKSAGITDPIQMSKQWIQLQNLRSKMKRKIDTKATKGRKIRYAVHSKLVNFMAPIDYCTMTEEAKNELYSSLFGRKL